MPSTPIFVEICGFRGEEDKNIDSILTIVNGIGNIPGIFISQIVDASLVSGENHLISAAWHVFRAVAAKRMISNSPSVEFLLYASGQRQISKALNVIGVKKSSEIIFVVAGESVDGVKGAIEQFRKHSGMMLDEVLLELTEEKESKLRDTFAIEKDTDLEEAILQKVALLALDTA